MTAMRVFHFLSISIYGFSSYSIITIQYSLPANAGRVYDALEKGWSWPPGAIPCEGQHIRPLLASPGLVPHLGSDLEGPWGQPLCHDSIIKKMMWFIFQEWTYESRKGLEHACHASFFFSIVVVQWATLIAVRTRRLSIFQYRNPLTNPVLCFGLVFETLLSMVIIYVPGKVTLCTTGEPMLHG